MVGEITNKKKVRIEERQIEAVKTIVRPMQARPAALAGSPLHCDPKVKETRIYKVLLGWVKQSINQK